MDEERFDDDLLGGAGRVIEPAMEVGVRPLVSSELDALSCSMRSLSCVMTVVGALLKSTRAWSHCTAAARWPSAATVLELTLSVTKSTMAGSIVSILRAVMARRNGEDWRYT
jgi:NAD/NADP transhydrogenase alpha subunit